MREDVARTASEQVVRTAGARRSRQREVGERNPAALLAAALIFVHRVVAIVTVRVNLLSVHSNLASTPISTPKVARALRVGHRR